MSVYLFNSLSDDEYSNFLIVAAFSNGPFSDKTFSPVNNSYLLTFPDDKAEFLAVRLNHIEIWFVRFCYQFF